MTATRSVHEMLGEPTVRYGYVIGVECENGHRSKTVNVNHLAEEGKQLRCEECGEPVTQTLMPQS